MVGKEHMDAWGGRSISGPWEQWWSAAVAILQAMERCTVRGHRVQWLSGGVWNQADGSDPSPTIHLGMFLKLCVLTSHLQNGTGKGSAYLIKLQCGYGSEYMQTAWNSGQQCLCPSYFSLWDQQHQVLCSPDRGTKQQKNRHKKGSQVDLGQGLFLWEPWHPYRAQWQEVTWASVL